MADYSTPAIALAEVQARVVAGRWHVRQEAQHDALALSPHLSIRACLLALTDADFHKSMDAEEPKWSGCRQDVYKVTFGGFELYLKFQEFPLGKNQIFVVSFKER